MIVASPSKCTPEGLQKKSSQKTADVLTKQKSQSPQRLHRCQPSVPDLDKKAFEYFSKHPKPLRQDPSFEPTDEKSLKSLTFESFLEHLKTLKEDHHATSRIVEIVSRLYAKKTENWVKVPIEDLFTWSDILISQICYKNVRSYLQPVAEFMRDVCKFFYKIFKKETRIWPPFEEFLTTPIFDYSRPYHWPYSQDYVCYAQVLMALNCEHEGANMPSSVEGFLLNTNSSHISKFQNMFAAYFPKKLTLDNISIPYALYKACWSSAQNESTIQPFDIEICFYFVQQNKLSLDYVVDKMWTEGSFLGELSCSSIKVVPLMKFFTIFDWKLLLTMNEIVGSLDLTEKWRDTASRTYFYKKSPMIDHIGWQGVSRKDIFQSHADSLSRFYSVADGYQMIFRLVHASLLNYILTDSLFRWQNQPAQKAYDVVYINCFNSALANLNRCTITILRAKDRVVTGNNPFVPCISKLLGEFPVIGLMGVLVLTIPVFKNLRHLAPGLREVLIDQKKEERSWFVHEFAITHKQKNDLSHLKPLSKALPKYTRVVIWKTQNDQTCQDFLVPSEVIFCHKSKRVSLSFSNRELMKKQGLFKFQNSKKLSLANAALHHLNSLSLRSSYRVNIHIKNARKILKMTNREAKKIPELADLEFMGSLCSRPESQDKKEEETKVQGQNQQGRISIQSAIDEFNSEVPHTANAPNQQTTREVQNATSVTRTGMNSGVAEETKIASSGTKAKLTKPKIKSTDIHPSKIGNFNNNRKGGGGGQGKDFTGDPRKTHTHKIEDKDGHISTVTHQGETHKNKNAKLASDGEEDDDEVPDLAAAAGIETGNDVVSNDDVEKDSDKGGSTDPVIDNPQYPANQKTTKSVGGTDSESGSDVDDDDDNNDDDDDDDDDDDNLSKNGDSDFKSEPEEIDTEGGSGSNPFADDFQNNEGIEAW